MSLTPEQIRMVREATGVVRSDRRAQLTSSEIDRLAALDVALGAGGAPQTWPTWKDAATLQLLLSSAAEVYRPAIQALMAELGISANATAPVPSTQPSPVSVDSSVTFTPAEIQVLGDLDFRAREWLGHTGPVVDRLLMLAGALKAGTWRMWQDANRSYIVSLMGSTDMGNDPAARPILLRFASAIGVTVVKATFPPLATQPPNVEAPPAADFGLWDTEPTPLVPGPSGEAFAKEVLEVVRNNTVRFDQHVGYGMWPIQNAEARVTIEHGQIIGVTPSNFQNDDEQMLPAGVVPKHGNVLDICNSDGGMGFVQYGWWYMGKVVRNTINRLLTVRRLDSMGESCWSTSAVHGQQYYERIAPNGDIHLCHFQPGKKVRLMGSSAYGATDIDLIQQAVDEALRARGL